MFHDMFVYCIISSHEHVKVKEDIVPDLGQPGLSTVISSAGDQPELNRIGGPWVRSQEFSGYFALYRRAWRARAASAMFYLSLKPNQPNQSGRLGYQDSYSYAPASGSLRSSHHDAGPK
jgi:hypothetical protein